ncbi:MAG: 2-oxoacid:acceptor oxidoreductase family protein [Desulfarculaceae bacterium]|jgi:2-oxoglutarate ferredoxin oxidoreductase subunit gamma
MQRVELTIAGVGGQGSILAGVILGSAAVSYDKKYAVQTSAYSSELRGGFAAAWVVLSDEPVVYPRVTEPDVLVAQAQDSIERFSAVLKPGGTLIYDSDMIADPPAGIKKAHGVGATLLARNELKAPIVANIIMLGALYKITEVVDRQALEKAIADAVPQGKAELNLKAFALGMEKVS